MPTLLLTGANRGLGLEFTRQYAQAEWRVHACCRTPETATALQTLASQQPNVTVHALDVTDGGAIAALATTLANQPIDVVLNNAGIYPDKGLAGVEIDESSWLDGFRINTLAPLRLTMALLANLELGELKLALAVTSRMGSIEDNTSGGSYGYRSSKAALNMVFKSLAIDLRPKNIAAVVLHPGWVQTDMGGSYAPLDAQTSVSGMREVIAGLDLSNSGRFLAYDGEQLPW